MGKIFPMASEKVREGFLRKRKRQAKRAARASGQATSFAVGAQQARDPARPDSTDGRES
jgi:hypothetical protein